MCAIRAKQGRDVFYYYIFGSGHASAGRYFGRLGYIAAPVKLFGFREGAVIVFVLSGVLTSQCRLEVILATPVYICIFMV